jgi:hypothetical protein
MTIIDQKIGEAADYLENACASFGPDEGIELTQDAWKRMRQAIVIVLPTVRMRST